MRAAIRTESKLGIRYAGERRKTIDERIVWPFALGYFNDVRILAAWCEGRNDFRHFRTDRIVALEPLDVRYPRRAALLKAWRAAGADARNGEVGGRGTQAAHPVPSCRRYSNVSSASNSSIVCRRRISRGAPRSTSTSGASGRLL